MSDSLRLQEKPIFADWLAEFPLLKRHKGGRRLLRICDPIVFGIELRKFTGSHGPRYRPEFVAQSLLKDWNGFDINRETHDRRHLQLYIDYEDHSKKWPDAAQALHLAFPLLTAAVVDERAMVELYRNELRDRMNGSGGAVTGTWESLVEILKYHSLSEYETEKDALLTYIRETPPVTTTFHHRFMGPAKDGGKHLEVVRERVEKHETPPYFPHKSAAEYEQEFANKVDVPVAVLLERRAERMAKGRWDRLPGVPCAGAAREQGACE